MIAHEEIIILHIQTRLYNYKINQLILFVIYRVILQ